MKEDIHLSSVPDRTRDVEVAFTAQAGRSYAPGQSFSVHQNLPAGDYTVSHGLNPAYTYRFENRQYPEDSADVLREVADMFTISYRITRPLDLSVSTAAVNCGTVRVGDGEPVKCPVVLITDGGKAPDLAAYDLVATVAPGPYDLYAEPGTGKIQKVVNDGEYVQPDGSLHLYLKGEGATAGAMSQVLTITARVK